MPFWRTSFSSYVISLVTDNQARTKTGPLSDGTVTISTLSDSTRSQLLLTPRCNCSCELFYLAFSGWQQCDRRCHLACSEEEKDDIFICDGCCSSPWHVTVGLDVRYILRPLHRFLQLELPDQPNLDLRAYSSISRCSSSARSVLNSLATNTQS
jgi:hypothetical protein